LQLTSSPNSQERERSIIVRIKGSPGHFFGGVKSKDPTEAKLSQNLHSRRRRVKGREAHGEVPRQWNIR